MGMSHKIKGHNYGYNYDWIWRCDEKRCDEKGGVTKKKRSRETKNTKAKGDNGRESFGFFQAKVLLHFLKSQNRENVSFEK